MLFLLQVVGSFGYQSNLVNFTPQASLSCLSFSVFLFLGSIHLWVHCLISVNLGILAYLVSRVRCLCFCLNHQLSSLRLVILHGSIFRFSNSTSSWVLAFLTSVCMMICSCFYHVCMSWLQGCVLIFKSC